MVDDLRFEIQIFVTATSNYDVVDLYDGLPKLDRLHTIAAVQAYLLRSKVNKEQISHALSQLARGKDVTVLGSKRRI
jgi:hypothetical protein